VVTFCADVVGSGVAWRGSSVTFACLNVHSFILGLHGSCCFLLLWCDCTMYIGVRSCFELC